MSPPQLPPLQAPRLLGQVRERVRYLHYSLRTEQPYVHWVRAFVRFHRMRHPREMGQPEIEAFLTWLTTERHVAVSTHRQALSALLQSKQGLLAQRIYGTGMRIAEVLHLRVKAGGGAVRSPLDALQPA
jgi:integrase